MQCEIRGLAMTAHDMRVAGDSGLMAEAARPITRPLDVLAILGLARRLVVFTPDGAQIASLMDKPREAIPSLTSAEVVQRVVSHNPGCFMAIARRDHFDIKNPIGEGYVAF